MLFESLLLLIYTFPTTTTLPIPKDVKPDYKVIKYTFTRDNDTDVMSPEAPSLELIPLDFLCEFCQVVILKLKDRQSTEYDFEEKIKMECENSTDSSLCDVINRVNLETLKNDEPRKICEKQKMCKNGDEIVHLEEEKKEEKEGNLQEEMAIIDNQNVNLTLNVEDIASPY